jgi:hypothetical protein
MPLDNKNAFGEPDNTETRYSGLVDQIDALLWMRHDNGSLSREQLAQLADLRNQVETYGERAAGWVKECDRALREQPAPARLESMMDFYTRFVNSFDCPPVLAEASTRMFKEVLLEASQSNGVAERLRQKVGVNPNETRGVGVFGISGDDNLPQQTTIDNEISDAMVSGTFDTIGDDISTTDPNNFDETALGLGSSETDTSGNDLNPDDWSADEPVADEGTGETEGSVEPEAELDAGTDDAEAEPEEPATEDNLETLDL